MLLHRKIVTSDILRPESDWHLINGNNLWFMESGLLNSDYHSPIWLKIIDKNERKIIDMNKTDLIAKISEVTEVSKKDVKAVVDALPDVIKDAVANDDKVALTGFATFSMFLYSNCIALCKMLPNIGLSISSDNSSVVLSLAIDAK